MNFVLYILLLSVNIISNFCINDNTNYERCGYVSCPVVDENVLNVHLVPHTHDDVGWLKTVDQYFYGGKRNIQRANVQLILDSVISALLKNPTRRFIYVETVYFWKWWQERNETIHEQVRYLVNNGQLEIAGGAWSMNDEAVTHYQSTIDQFTWGFRKLNETLGKYARPKIAWQIDPFGHSREMASLFSQFGFDGQFMARIDYRDKEQRLKTKTAEMIWKSSDNLGEPANLFTSVFYNHYSAPRGFCFDVLCEDRITDDSKIYMATSFVNYAENHAKHYKTNNILVPMGDDFHYQEAHTNFDNIDKLLQTIRELPTNINVFYSSPSCYLKAVNEQNETWPIKSDDFFPYASDYISYWTGYFTSRPALKKFERTGNNFLQVSKQLAALSNIEDSALGLDPLREAMGILQHHDAITGTEKQHVANDYARILSEAIDVAEEISNNALRQLSGQQNKIAFQNCLLFNISQCYLTEENDDFFVTVYNPLSRQNSHYIRIPVSKKEYKVYDLNGNEAQVQYVPIFDMIKDIPGRNSTAEGEIVFKAELPPLGFKIYQVKYNSSYQEVYNENLKSGKINAEFSSTGHIKTISINNKTKIPFKQDFLYYIGDSGQRSSGAYVFKPLLENATIISQNVTVKKYSGPLVTEYHQKFNSWVGQIIRIYHDEEHIEFNWIVGPIFTKDGNGREVISRFSTNLNNEGIFYTDSNGREMIKRIRNYRSNYKINSIDPVSENYYPITSKILIKDEQLNLQLAILNDRAQGGSSLTDGEIELMVHRRLLYDDGLGVGESLDETAYGEGLVVTGKHYVVLGPIKGSSSTSKEKDLAQQILLAPWIFTTPTSKITNNIIKKMKPEFSGLRKQLPRNVNILTLEPWNKNALLLRLEHIFEKNEDRRYSGPVKINIENLFSTFRIKEFKEMSLGANQLLSEIHRLSWQTETDEKVYNYNNNIYKNINTETNNSTEIILQPMQIKTFIIQIESFMNTTSIRRKKNTNTSFVDN